MEKMVLNRYREEVLAELKEDILEFWLKHVIDFESNSFNGAVSGQGVVDPLADKGAILAARILWTYSLAWSKLKDQRYLRAAQLMSRYILDHFIDKEHGGVYWMLDAKGKPVDSTKKFYALAFTIYALAEFARATGDHLAMDQAMALFYTIEKHGRDPLKGGYIDALGRDWSPIADTRLSEKDLNMPKTMNTNLHVLEAYSLLSLHAPGTAVKSALQDLIKVFLHKILRPDQHFGLFFDMDWKEVSGAISYGHDIEGSWLMLEAAERAGDKVLLQEVKATAVAMARAVLAEGTDAEGSVLNERQADGAVHAGREWWIQAEAMVGFFNAYQMTGDEAYAATSLKAWAYLKKHFFRPGGEWYPSLYTDGRPDTEQVIAGPWKCPYHNARACFEIAERVEAKLGKV